MTGGLTPELPGLLRMVPASLGPSLPQLTFIESPSEPSSTLKMKQEVLRVRTRPFISRPWLPDLPVSLCTLAASGPYARKASVPHPAAHSSGCSWPSPLQAAEPLPHLPQILRHTSFHSITLVHLNQSISPSGISHLVILTCNTFLLSE